MNVLKYALFECTRLATTAALDQFCFQNPQLENSAVLSISLFLWTLIRRMSGSGLGQTTCINPWGRKISFISEGFPLASLWHMSSLISQSLTHLVHSTLILYSLIFKHKSHCIRATYFSGKYFINAICFLVSLAFKFNFSTTRLEQIELTLLSSLQHFLYLGKIILHRPTGQSIQVWFQKHWPVDIFLLHFFPINIETIFFRSSWHVLSS